MNTTQRLILLFLLSAGCATQDICDNDNQSYLVARFLTSVNGEDADTTLTGLTVYGIRDTAPDGLLYDSMTVKQILLPLDPNREESVFVLVKETRRDTLTVKYSSEAYLISYNCGFAARFDLRSPEHTGNLIRDVEIFNSQVDAETETNETHIHIFF